MITEISKDQRDNMIDDQRVFAKNICICFAVFLFFTLSTWSALGMDKNSKGTNGPTSAIELQLSGEPLKDAAAEVSKQTGYSIVIEKELAELSVSGVYHGVTIENFFQRVLKGKNISIISDDNKKTILVRFFGEKGLDNLITISDDLLGAKNNSSDAVDPLDGQKLSEIKEIQSRYEAEVNRWKNDPDAVDPLDGQKISEIKEIQTQYDTEVNRRKNDPDAVDPLDGQKLSEIKALQAEYEQTVANRKDDPSAVDSIDGQPLAEINELRVKHDAAMERWKNDPDAVDPMDGQKMSEIRQIQAEYEAGK